MAMATSLVKRRQQVPKPCGSLEIMVVLNSTPTIAAIKSVSIWEKSSPLAPYLNTRDPIG